MPDRSNVDLRNHDDPAGEAGRDVSQKLNSFNGVMQQLAYHAMGRQRGSVTADLADERVGHAAEDNQPVTAVDYGGQIVCAACSGNPCLCAVDQIETEVATAPKPESGSEQGQDSHLQLVKDDQTTAAASAQREYDTEPTGVEANSAKPEKTMLEARRDAVAKLGGTPLERMTTEFAAYRETTETRIAQAAAGARAELMADLLPVLDVADMARANGEMGRGGETVADALEVAAEKHGLERINAKGEPFDPTLHEAVVSNVGPGAGEPTVDQEMQAGYTVDGALLRPTRVGVMEGMSPELVQDAHEQASDAQVAAAESGWQRALANDGTTKTDVPLKSGSAAAVKAQMTPAGSAARDSAGDANESVGREAHIADPNAVDLSELNGNEYAESALQEAAEQLTRSR